jgi:hypothetical protein
VAAAALQNDAVSAHAVATSGPVAVSKQAKSAAGRHETLRETRMIGSCPIR